MIEGLRLLPWVQWQRSNLKKKARVGSISGAEDYLNCRTCQFDDHTKQRYHCGWLPKEQHIPHGFPSPVGFPESEVCPGYSIQLPDVLEAGRALRWASRGSLRDFYDVPITALVRNCIDILDAEKDAVESHAFRVASEDSKK